MSSLYNILYLHSHDVGRLVQPYGYPVETSNLLSLSRDAVMFDNMFSCAPTCSPSRAALLSGQYPHSYGQLGLAHRGFSPPSHKHHLANYLAASAYHTVLSGVQHEAAPGPRAHTQLGYASRIDEAESADTAAARFLGTNPTRPFFLSCGLSQTHRPFPELTSAERRASRGPGAMTPPGYQSEVAFREDFEGFRKAVASVDVAMGRVLDALYSTGLADSTVVIVTTDHGPAFPEMKGTLRDSGTGVMFFVRAPGISARRTSALASHVDVFPTLCELCGLAAPAWNEGMSLVPILDGSRQQTRQYVFTEMNFHAVADPQRAVRTDRYKLIRRYGPVDTHALANVDDSRSKRRFLEMGWRKGVRETQALYDLFFDPFEHANKWDDAELTERRLNMERVLAEWMQVTNDPLLTASGLRVPSGAEVNQADARSHTEQTIFAD